MAFEIRHRTVKGGGSIGHNESTLSQCMIDKIRTLRVSFAPGFKILANAKYDILWGTSDSPDCGKMRLYFSDEGTRKLAKSHVSKSGRSTFQITGSSIDSSIPFVKMGAKRMTVTRIDQDTVEINILKIVEKEWDNDVQDSTTEDRW